MAGYVDRVITLEFPQLVDPGDSVWVAIRNPRREPQSVLMPVPIVLDDAGVPRSADEAVAALHATIARLVVAWRMYDSEAVEVDDWGRPLDQPLLPLPATAQLVGRLPTEVVTAIGAEIKSAVAPDIGPGSPYFEDVLLVAESIYENTWSSGAPPQEFIDFELCDQLGWSWPDLEATPLYVRNTFWRLLQARRQAEKDRQDEASRKAERRA